MKAEQDPNSNEKPNPTILRKIEIQAIHIKPKT
ncbi:MAG: hypothetical protein JWP27_1550 [Flaviaesturariibacter sp.]|nr:hypothetical protein [Flaviaesturariibacter sp.]